MRKEDCVEFLQWAVPRMGLRWPGFTRVRRQVCKRIDRRLMDLGLADVRAYRDHLATHADEWQVLDAMCRIPISRFYRDHGTFEHLGRDVLPQLAAGGGTLHCWCAGCARGEEAYSLALLWHLALAECFPATNLHIVATDSDARLLAQAKRACYAKSSLKELPPAWLAAAFTRANDLYCLQPAFRRGIDFLEQDIRKRQPQGPFALVLCRNLVFTYFAEALQLKVLAAIRAHMAPTGFLVIGSHETLPAGCAAFTPYLPANGIYRAGAFFIPHREKRGFPDAHKIKRLCA